MPKKKGKRGNKKQGDSFEKKVWFTVQAPQPFKKLDIGHMPVNKSQGMYNCADQLKGRIVEANLSDLSGKDESRAHQNIRLRVEEIVGNNCLTSFVGLNFTRDKVCSLIRKWQTLIEAEIELKTTDGYVLRLFCIGFTERRRNQIKKTCYAKASQIKRIRKRMFAIMRDEVTNCELKAVIDKFIGNTIGLKINKACQSIYPLKDVYIRKVKVISSPKYDVHKFNDGIKKEDIGKVIEDK